MMPIHLQRLRPRGSIAGTRISARLFGVAAVLVGLAAAGPLEAQESGGALSSGAAALNSGKYDSAVKQLSSAINSDKIAPAEAAKALYLRGIAYRKLNQHSRSIADLGAAIWLGLPPADRLKAQVNRGLAYRAAGLSGEGDAEIAAARKTDPGGDVDRLIAENGGAGGDTTAIAAFSTEVHTGDQGGGIAPAKPEPMPGFNTTVTGGDKPQAPPAQTADASSRWSTSVGNGDQPQPPARQGPAPAPGSWSTSTSDASAEAPASGGNRVSRWFNSLTSSSGNEAPPPPASASPSAPAPAPSSPAPHPASAPSAGWDASTQVVTADARPASGDSGSFRLQLTSSRSEAEAKELWQKVVNQNPGLAGREPDIQKTDIGGLGVFYRLQIGPFPDKSESLKLCNALKRSGVDCFLVTG